MSLVWYDPFEARPSRFFNHTVSTLDDFFGVPREYKNWLNVRPDWNQLFSDLDSDAEVKFDKDRFNANVDVQQFKPEEISVKVSEKDNSITVEGKHEERQDEHGYISRQFTRRYVLPKDHDISKVESRLSSDGVLCISAPKIGDPKSGERQIPITHTGQPSKAVEHKSKGKK